MVWESEKNVTGIKWFQQAGHLNLLKISKHLGKVRMQYRGREIFIFKEGETTSLPIPLTNYSLLSITKPTQITLLLKDTVIWPLF